MPLQFPYTKDNRIVLGTYAWIAGIGGAIVTLFGWRGFPDDLPGMPFGMEALMRVFGTSMAASGCWAAMLSQMGDPELRRKGFRWFAAAHFLVLLFLHLQSIAIWPPVITSRLEPIIPFEFMIVLFLLIHSESYFIDRDTGVPIVVVSAEPARTTYERQIRQAGAQEERNRLARDLHDSIKQQIFVIQTAAATAQTRFDSDHAGAAQALDQIRNSARDAMTEMEVMMDQLRSVPLENTGLIEALKKQCEALGHRTGAHVTFTLGELPDTETILPGAHQTILRVAQEACANIGRHARASNVTVSLGSVNGQLELQIRDDGVGFQPMRGQSGMGIANMRARATEIGGRFTLTSQPEGGTTVIFSVPGNTQLTPGRRQEYLHQTMIYLAMFAAVVAFMPAKQRTFAVCAWGLAGVAKVFQWMRARRRSLHGKTA